MDYITSSFENGVLTLFAHGRIDTTTAPEAEKAIFAALDENPTDAVLMDAEDLQYISSAGLRVVLRLRKTKPSLKIVNVTSEVYEIFEMTGFTEMVTIEKAYRKLSVDGCTVIGKGAKGTVYRYNADTIVKVYNDADILPSIHRERELARKAFVLGIPTAISYDVVKVGDKFGSVFELLDAQCYSMLIHDDPANIEKYVRDYALLLRQIHETPVKADDMPDAKIVAEKWLDGCKPYLEAADYEKICALVHALPDNLTMIHGDYHTNNIMNQNGETLLIDMDTLSHGHPIIELVSVYATYVGFTEVDPKNVEDFLGLDVPTSHKIWQIFLPIYLGTNDEKVLADVEKKVKLLASTRIIRHTTRRGIDTPEKQKAVDNCIKTIHELLKTTDTLVF